MLANHVDWIMNMPVFFTYTFSVFTKDINVNFFPENV